MMWEMIILLLVSFMILLVHEVADDLMDHKHTVLLYQTQSECRYMIYIIMAHELVMRFDCQAQDDLTVILCQLTMYG